VTTLDTMPEAEPKLVPVTRVTFETALPALRPEVHRYCSRMMGSVIDGEDIVQITLIKALEALERGDHVNTLRPWLFRIAHNSAMDHLRKRKRETAMYEQSKSSQAELADAP
jgi:RNA polymerase sigma factor (sigma-70 family)